MPRKSIQRFLLLTLFICWGFLASLAITTITIGSVNAEDSSSKAIEFATKITPLESRGMQLYTQGNLEAAIAIWQQAGQTYANAGNFLGESRVLSNIALAYGELGNWHKAQSEIDRSFKLVENNTSLPKDIQRSRTLAQIFNNRGILELSMGNAETAVSLWQQAATYYQEVGDELGKIRTTINQASALKQLGFYRRAVNNLTQIEPLLNQQSDSAIKTTALRNYGDILRLIGQIDRAKQVTEASLKIANNLNAPLESVKSLLVLGKIQQADGDLESALLSYQQGWQLCQQATECLPTNLSLQINLAQLNLLLKTKYWQRVRDLIPTIQSSLQNLPIDRANIELQLNFAANLVELQQKDRAFSSWEEIQSILVAAIDNTRMLQDRRLESYALGLQGKVNEKLAKWQEASEKTQQALIIAQNLNAPEISYLWQWQLGRIARAQDDKLAAIAHYAEAVTILKSLSQDLVAIDPGLQYSFRESVEPVYRDLVGLLLTNEAKETISQVNLETARQTIESLQLAELHNFFREACLDAQPMQIDRVDNKAAVIYPIILDDRFDIILSLPEQPLRHYYTKIDRQKLESVIQSFHQNIVIRSRRKFYAPARQLYNWIVSPVLEDLKRNHIETIVFVPDGLLRNIPLSALHDGKHFLIENYNVALTPGLQLLAPRPLQNIKLKTIAAGLSEQRQGFTALEYVPMELTEIQSKIDSTILMDRKFTTEALTKAIEFSDYPIVHIATHGQFSSSLEDTFLLTWDSRIDIEHLNRILQTRTPSQQQAIELLVLSACESATGDKWAALGLAGMAVRAGAKSTLATLWAVNDLATAELMTEFYQQLSVKSSIDPGYRITKAKAIREAQLKLLHSRWYKHPFYWAPYVLLGNWL
jgi:CHAT domain-containing protein/exonuclease VII small subunit